jgi:methylenetetrahydrofolate dehydrogenase (NADP+)/methenyltetrahydrofolate cyclohydrolase/formyltetrahydrofolate synthetase
MAFVNTDSGLLATILNRLEPLDDDYVLAFGPEGKQFFATPNGYTT